MSICASRSAKRRPPRTSRRRETRRRSLRREKESVVTDLHPRDEKVLTAKALAYEVLAQREQSLRKEGDDRFREVDESIGSIETLPGAAEAQVSLDKFLGEALAYLDGRLTRTFKKPGPVKAYLAQLRQTIKNPVSITTQCQRWLAALHAIGARYL